MFVEVHLRYRDSRGMEKHVVSQDLAFSEEGITVLAGNYETTIGGDLLFLKLKTTEPLELVDFQVEAWLGVDPDALMMVNGFQSWSESREMGRNERIKPVSSLSRFATSPYGDYSFYKYTGKNGRFHSWTYTYFQSAVQEFFLLGSVDESPGYTLFDYDFSNGKLIISRDCQGASVKPGSQYTLLSLYTGKGDEKSLFKDYFSLWSMSKKRKNAPRCTGWTSWYNYYTDISEAIVDTNLRSLHKEKIPVDYFQIDDGYQEAVGDWLEINDKFPSGMGAVAEKIRKSGYKPGLWLAPFICEDQSRLFRDHPEWLLRDDGGKPVRAGWNPLWSGFFYALNFYADGFRDYLKEVFHTVGEEWGFELLKLDFLYATAILPQDGRSRGQIMSEAMDFFDDISGKRRLLGCGVPLGPAFGKVDYCRIGSDVGPFWEFRFLNQLNVRERVSTINSLHSTLGRFRLDGHVFRNDPDVFIMRDGTPRVNHNKLNNHQRYTLFFLNHLLGGLVFLSDDVAEYSTEQINIIRRAYPVLEREINDIVPDGELYRIRFTVNGKEYLSLSNLSNKPCRVKVDDKTYFNPKLFVVKGGSSVTLSAYQTICLREAELRQDKPTILGATGHIFPGAQVEKIIARKDNLILKINPEASEETSVFLGVPEGEETLRVNGSDYPVSFRDGIYYVTVKSEVESQKSEAGDKKTAKKQDAGDKKQDTGSEKQEAGDKKKDTSKKQKQAVEGKTSGVRSKKQDTGSKKQDTELKDKE